MTRRYLVSGRVQGVGFRWFVLRQAERERLTGFARNLPDGTVEVVAAGDVVALERLAAALRVGPPHARVDNVIISDAPAAPASSRFEIR
ncbi:MAG TPA: acylphosphatase [Gemmatimonadales bacterium]|nr:acylphosphatase [Gemmatimonadales bacterium]